ncbi:BioY protein [Halovivax asiaticus JCM 14624]|uniref:BioY protein n=1 Tax=Halovivax asiaticus JCM 14624 TaxID=1227490 RepID=M0BCE2_9EURY|nr:biotin transporter BioY [Halovivax asiaticus]ELZ08571.1 BioY protein [Halovivax asiaticus JCM 14624]
MSTDHEYDSVALVPESIVRPFARAALLAALTGAVAFVSIPIPFSPAPLTLQVLFVFLAGLYLGPVWGSVSLLLYLTAGGAGAPIFAGGHAGIGHLFGKTGGFLWSYPIAAFVIGALVHGRTGFGFGSIDPTADETPSGGFFDSLEVRDPATVGLGRLVVALSVGTLIVYAIGAGYAMWLLSLSPVEAVAQFVAPFVIGEVLKMAATIALVRDGRYELS